MFTEDTLKDKVILITGGGTGLGFAMARRFVQMGAKVAICGRRVEKLTEAAAAIHAETPGAEVFTHAADVRDYEAIGVMMDAIRAHFGTLNGLVNNAAGNFLSASEDLTPGGFRAVVDIVLHGAFNCTQQFGKHLIDHNLPGVVLNIVTTYTETGSAFVLPSACAKAGVQALTTSLAYEWGPYGIRLNSIAPGPFPTEGAWSRLIPNMDAEAMMADNNPLGRVGRHEELADLAVFLMSDQSAYINGACVPIDGGERLQGAQFNFFSRMAPRAEIKAMFRSMRGKEQ